MDAVKGKNAAVGVLLAGLIAFGGLGFLAQSGKNILGDFNEKAASTSGPAPVAKGKNRAGNNPVREVAPPVVRTAPRGLTPVDSVGTGPSDDGSTMMLIFNTPQGSVPFSPKCDEIENMMVPGGLGAYAASKGFFVPPGTPGADFAKGRLHNGCISVENDLGSRDFDLQ